MAIADVLHHLVENSQAFDAETRVQAHKDISEHFGEDERHYAVPDPDAETPAEAPAEDGDKDAEIARLRAELAAKDDKG